MTRNTDSGNGAAMPGFVDASKSVAEKLAVRADAASHMFFTPRADAASHMFFTPRADAASHMFFTPRAEAASHMFFGG